MPEAAVVGQGVMEPVYRSVVLALMGHIHCPVNWEHRSIITTRLNHLLRVKAEEPDAIMGGTRTVASL